MSTSNMDPHKNTPNIPKQSLTNLSNADLLERNSRAGEAYDRFSEERPMRLKLLRTALANEEEGFKQNAREVETLRTVAKPIGIEQLDSSRSQVLRQVLEESIHSLENATISGSKLFGDDIQIPEQGAQDASRTGLLGTTSGEEEKVVAATRPSKKIPFLKFAKEMDDVEEEARATSIRADIESKEITFLRRMAGLWFLLKKRGGVNRDTDDFRLSRPSTYTNDGSSEMPPKWKQKKSRFGHILSMIEKSNMRTQGSLPAGLLPFKFSRDFPEMDEAALKAHEWWNYPELDSGETDEQMQDQE